MGDAVIGGPEPASLRGTRFPVPAWRRVLGLAITLASFAAVALVGQAFGWLTDAQASARAAQAADGQARLVVMALRQLTPDGAPGESRFAEVAGGLAALLVRDEHHGTAEAVLTVQVHGHTTAGAFGGSRVVDVVRCYAVDWRPPFVADPVPVDCPALPQVPEQAPSGVRLAQQLNTIGGLGSGPYLAVGVPGACAFGEEGRHGFTAWPAPALSPCDAAEAARAAAFTD